MSPTLFIYTCIDEINEHFDLNYEHINLNYEKPYFNNFKYENLIFEGGLIKWIIAECEEIKIVDKYGNEDHYYVLDKLDKIDDLKDKIWNRQINNYIFYAGISALDFAYDSWDFIKNGGTLYFIV